MMIAQSTEWREEMGDLAAAAQIAIAGRETDNGGTIPGGSGDPPRGHKEDSTLRQKNKKGTKKG
jgi:hypothetical protein